MVVAQFESLRLLSGSQNADVTMRGIRDSLLVSQQQQRLGGCRNISILYKTYYSIPVEDIAAKLY
jgi:hypothetical protein